jgi:hypothetical protein
MQSCDKSAIKRKITSASSRDGDMGGGFPPFSSRVENGDGPIGRLGLRWRLGSLVVHVQVFRKVVMCSPLADEAGGRTKTYVNFGYISRSKRS